MEKALGVPVLRHTIKKPGGGDALLQRFHGVAKPQQMAMVGDRLFTDVLFGNLNGNITVLTRQIISEKGDNPIAAKVSVSVAWSRNQCPIKNLLFLLPDTTLRAPPIRHFAETENAASQG